jgi:holliday junction DNA helicase RuvA
VIARLAGKLAEKGADHAVVDVGGVGYLVHLSAVTLALLPPQGGVVSLRTFMNVRQDAIDLFGFATEDEEGVFRALIDVKGVGPRAAQNILSGIDARELAQAVAAGDVARLTKVPGIGKKTAERLLLELKGKLGALGAAPGSEKASDVLNALLALGYSEKEALAATREVAPGTPVAEGIRAALKSLAKS